MQLLSILELLKQWDTQLFLLINGAHSTLLDSMMHFISYKLFWIPLYLILLVLLAQKLGKKTFLLLVFVAITIAITDQVCLHFFKNNFQRLRPCHDAILMAKVHLVDPCGGWFGFVSSHAANSFALAFFLFPCFEFFGRYRYLFFIWAAIVSYSRIYLGQHYPSDVFVGALVGLMVAAFVSKAYIYTQQKLDHV